MKMIIIGLLIMFLLAGNTKTSQYQIRGTIHDLPNLENKTTGNIHIFLLTENTFQKPYKGIREIEVDVKNQQKSVDFIINDVKPGVYGLRCYLDKNNNNELDRFLMIPKEPWTLSWKNNEKRIPPDFEDISFTVRKNLTMDLYLDD